MNEDWTQTIVIIASIIGVMIVLYRQADKGFDAVNKRIDDLRSDTNKRSDDLRDSLGSDIQELHEDVRLILHKLIPRRKE